MLRGSLGVCRRNATADATATADAADADVSCMHSYFCLR